MKKYRVRSRLNFESKNGRPAELDGHAENWMQSLLVGQHVEDEADNGHDVSRRRILLMLAAMAVAFAILLSRLFVMQVISAQEYAVQAEGNRIREIVQYAPRGRILDRSGEILADNTLTFQLSAVPYLLEQDEAKQQADIHKIARITGLSRAAVEKKLFEQGKQYVQPVVVADRLSHEQALRLDTQIPSLKGYSLDEIPIRSYDASAGLAHVVGYTGRVSEEDLNNDRRDKLLLTDFIGKAGVEKSYDDILRGRNGWQRIEVDALGRPVRVLGKREPKPGQDIQLTIGIDVQKSMEAAMKNQMKTANVTRASGVAVDPRDGSIIAMVSIPYYDNNLFAEGISDREYNRLIKDQNQPLYNKVIGGGFTTGSIIKPLVASAALQEQVVDENTVIVDGGHIDVVSQYDPGAYFRFHGWRPGGLGPMNIRRAIAWSSNIYFYTVGGGHGGIEGLGGERLSYYYRHFGLGTPSGIELPGETAGRVPDDEWKQAHKGEPWYVGDSYNISIGQGDMLVSPLQITMAEAAIANNGYLIKPKLLLEEARDVRWELDVDKQYLQIVREGMRQVLTDGTTCDCVFEKVPVTVAGKTGTAQTTSDESRRPHAWFTAFAPYEQPKVLMTVLLEEGIGGSQFAAPVIADAMAAYFDR